MAQDKPTDYPRWADDPPGSTITEPTEAQKDDGYQPGKPVRQYTNWLLNLIYQWIVWLSSALWKPGDVFADQALPLGTAPVTGAGLVVAAASFSGKAYVGGYSTDLVDGPAHEYGITTDTYWDLGRDNAWTPAVVAAGAGAPAVTANSVRFYKVTTNGVDRTTVVDLRRVDVRVDALLNTGTVRVRTEITADTDNTATVGSVAKTFADVYATNLHSTNVDTDNFQTDFVLSDLIPNPADSLDIGAGGTEWDQAFINNVNCVALSATTAVIGALAGNVLPDVTATRSIGTSGNKFTAGWFANGVTAAVATQRNIAGSSGAIGNTSTDFYAFSGSLYKVATVNASIAYYDLGMIPDGCLISAINVTGTFAVGLWLAYVIRGNRLTGAQDMLIAAGSVTLSGTDNQVAINPDQNHTVNLSTYYYYIVIDTDSAATGILRSFAVGWTNTAKLLD